MSEVLDQRSEEWVSDWVTRNPHRQRVWWAYREKVRNPERFVLHINYRIDRILEFFAHFVLHTHATSSMFICQLVTLRSLRVSTVVKKCLQLDAVVKLWKNGFSVNDGPLRTFDDEENKEFLDSIRKGYVEASVNFCGMKLKILWKSNDSHSDVVHLVPLVWSLARAITWLLRTDKLLFFWLWKSVHSHRTNVKMKISL